MKTIREYISQVKKLVKETNPDSRLTNKAVYSLLTKHARWLIRREANALKLTRFQDLYQIIDCVEVVEAPAIDPCCGISTLCTVYRTKDPLPELYEDSAGVLIQNVFSIDGSQEYTFTTAASVLRKLKSPYTRLQPAIYVYYHNRHLYFTSMIRMVKVNGLFVTRVVSPCNPDTTCIPFMDTPFFLPSYLEGELVANTVKELVQTYKQLPDDNNTNANPNT